MSSSAERRAMSRMAALGAVACLAVFGPVLEGTLGGGRGWAIGFMLMLLAPSALRAGGPRWHPLDPETFVPVMYFLSAGYSPCLHLLSSRNLQLSSAEGAAFEVAYMGSVGCALVCIGLSRPPKDPAILRWGLPDRVLPRDWAVIATGLAGAILVASWVLSTGLSALLASSYAETYQREEGKGLLVSGWYFIQLAIVHCVARIADFRRVGTRVPRALIAAVGVMIFAFLLSVALGRRGPLVWVLTSVVLCLHVSGIEVRRRWIALAAAATVVYGVAIEGYRTELGQAAETRLEAVRAGFERVDNPLVIQELEVVFANLTVIVDERPPIVHYPGESWVNAFPMLIPKPIWANRPTGLAQRYVMWASPSFAREGGGYAFSATAEGFVNMGLAGAVIEVSTFTIVFFFLPLALCVGSARDPLFRALAACLASFSYNQFRGELASMLKIALSFLLAAAFVHLASAVFQQLGRELMRPAPRGSRERLREGQPGAP